MMINNMAMKMGASGIKRPDDYKGLVDTSSWFIDAGRPQGLVRTILAPRTLPNGVSNGEYLKNVSDDLVLQASDFIGVADTGGITVASTSQSILVGMLNINTSDIVATKLKSSYGEPLNSASVGPSSIGKYYFAGTTFRYILPLGTTLEQARELLAGTIVSYQLAVPIDTLNDPQINPIIDQSGVVGENLFDGFWELGGYVIATGADYTTSDRIRNAIRFIPVKPNTRYRCDQFIDIWFYDSNKVFISKSATTFKDFTTPANAKYINFVHYVVNFNLKMMLNEGDTQLPYEPYGKSNGLLQGFAFTNADGYVERVAPNGKTVTGLKGDAVNSVVKLNAESAPNPVGTQDFAFGYVVEHPETLANGSIFSRNTATGTDWQCGVFVISDGSGRVRAGLQNLVLPAGTFSASAFEKHVLRRDGNTLTLKVNGVVVYENTNFTTSLVSAPNVFLMGRSSIADGSTQTERYGGTIFLMSYADTNLDTWEANFNKLAARDFGL